MAALDDADRIVRANSARALGKLGTNALSAVARLRKQLADELPPSARAAEALVLIAGGTPGPGDPALEEALAAIEASRDDYFRVTALSVRVRRGQESPDLAPACLRLLKSPLSYNRWEAAERLGEVKVADEGVLRALTKAAEDSNGLVREKARRSLKKLKFSASGA